jgi:hypothetical protein
MRHVECDLSPHRRHCIPIVLQNRQKLCMFNFFLRVARRDLLSQKRSTCGRSVNTLATCSMRHVGRTCNFVERFFLRVTGTVDFLAFYKLDGNIYTVLDGLLETLSRTVVCKHMLTGEITELQCSNDGQMNIVDLIGLGVDGQRAPEWLQQCPALSTMRTRASANCNGHRMCRFTAASLGLRVDQCTGVVGVNFYFNCTRRGFDFRCFTIMIVDV